jgi:hypothetical protein
MFWDASTIDDNPLIRPVQHPAATPEPAPAATPDPSQTAIVNNTELVVGELITTRGNRFVCISVHPLIPLPPCSLVVVIFNVHSDRSFSSLCSQSWKTAGDVVGAFSTMLEVHRVRLDTMEDDQSSFTAVISTDKDVE